MEIDKFENDCRNYLKQYVPFHGNDVFVAGGFFCRFFHGLPIRDIDIFVKKELMSDLRKEINHLNDMDVQQESKNNDFIKYRFLNGLEIELISFHNPQSMECIKYFDFEHCGFALSEKGIYHLRHTLRDIENKNIRISSMWNPSRVFGTNIGYMKSNKLVERMKKYIDLGFSINDEQLHILCSKLFFGDYKISKKDRAWLSSLEPANEICILPSELESDIEWEEASL